MKIRQLSKIVEVNANQRVRINDGRTYRKFETDCGWEMDIDRDEHERVLNLTVDGVSFNNDWLIVWAH